MDAIASQITSLTIANRLFRRKHQSPASLAFVRGIHRGPHKWPVTRKKVSIWWRHHVYFQIITELYDTVSLSSGALILRSEALLIIQLTTIYSISPVAVSQPSMNGFDSIYNGKSKWYKLKRRVLTRDTPVALHMGKIFDTTVSSKSDGFFYHCHRIVVCNIVLCETRFIEGRLKCMPLDQ